MTGGPELTGMLALTLRQPWAHALTHLGKNRENRDWMTFHRGEVAVHAGRSWDAPALEFPPLMEVWEKFTAQLPGGDGRRAPLSRDTAGMAFGAVVAVADLTAICSMNRMARQCECGPWARWGSDHWRFDNVRALSEPVPVRGYQKLWRLPPLVEARVRAQL